MKSFLVASTLFIFAVSFSHHFKNCANKNLIKVVQAQNSKKECEAIEKLSFVDPMSCCKYPTIKYNESIIATCVKECETGSESGYDKANCCFNFCLDRETGMFVDGELHPNKLVDAFTGSSSKDMSDKWREIVTNVVTDCQSLCKYSKFEKLPDCKTT